MFRIGCFGTSTVGLVSKRTSHGPVQVYNSSGAVMLHTRTKDVCWIDQHNSFVQQPRQTLAGAGLQLGTANTRMIALCANEKHPLIRALRTCVCLVAPALNVTLNVIKDISIDACHGVLVCNRRRRCRRTHVALRLRIR